jgi:hypothetical protein
MVADKLLSRLRGVKRVAEGRWKACCPAHRDNTPSLDITEKPDGVVLFTCRAGCEQSAVVEAVGLTFADLFPEKRIEYSPRLRQPAIPAQVFDIARREICVAALIASDMRAERAISDEDYARLIVAAQRLNEIGSAAYDR